MTGAPLESLSVGSWGRFDIMAWSVCDGRRLSNTKLGYYGLGPKCVREGGIIAVLFAGNVPYVLRPIQDGYLFLGGCYLEGLMNGALLEGLEKGVIKELVFSLH